MSETLSEQDRKKLEAIAACWEHPFGVADSCSRCQGRLEVAILGYAAGCSAQKERDAQVVESYISTPHSACRNALQEQGFSGGYMIGHRKDCLYSIAGAIRGAEDADDSSRA